MEDLIATLQEKTKGIMKKIEPIVTNIVIVNEKINNLHGKDKALIIDELYEIKVFHFRELRSVLEIV